MKLLAEKRQETNLLHNVEKVIWIEDYGKRDVAVARKQVQEAETASIQELEDKTTNENAGMTTRKSETTFEVMLNAISVRLSNLESSDDEQDEKDEKDDEEDTELGKLSDDDKLDWVMVTILKTEQHRLEAFRLKQMRLNELTELRSG